MVHAAVQGWGLSNVQESMLGHEAMSRMLDFDDDLDMLGAGIMSVDSGLSVPTLNLFRGMWSTFKAREA